MTEPHSCTEPHRAARGDTEPPDAVRSHMDSRVVARGYTELYRATRSCTEPHGAVRSHAEPQGVTRNHTELHGATRSYKELARSHTELHGANTKPHGVTRNQRGASAEPHEVARNCTIARGRTEQHTTARALALAMAVQRRAQSKCSAWTDYQITSGLAHDGTARSHAQPHAVAPSHTELPGATQQSCTESHRVVLSHMEPRVVARKHTELYRATQSCTEPHGATKSYMEPYGTTRSHTELQEATRSYTELHGSRRSWSPWPPPLSFREQLVSQQICRNLQATAYFHNTSVNCPENLGEPCGSEDCIAPCIRALSWEHENGQQWKHSGRGIWPQPRFPGQVHQGEAASSPWCRSTRTGIWLWAGERQGGGGGGGGGTSCANQQLEHTKTEPRVRIDGE
eukprot:gene8190-biopygen1567